MQSKRPTKFLGTRVVYGHTNYRQQPSTTDNYRQQADNYRQQADDTDNESKSVCL